MIIIIYVTYTVMAVDFDSNKACITVWFEQMKSIIL